MKINKGNIRMTIEEEFFKAFEIKPQCIIDPFACPTGLDVMNACYKCQYATFKEITAERVLQLIVLMFSYNDFLALEDDGFSLDFLTVEEFKEEVLKQLIRDACTDSLKQQVRKLFEE